MAKIKSQKTSLRSRQSCGIILPLILFCLVAITLFSFYVMSTAATAAGNEVLLPSTVSQLFNKVSENLIGNEFLKPPPFDEKGLADKALPRTSPPLPDATSNVLNGNTVIPGIKEPEIPFQVRYPKKEKDAFDFHFIHIPKCGGTSMTAVLREVACNIDPERNSDCCTNPGFCDWHAFRRCASIRGCINHIPQRYCSWDVIDAIDVIDIDVCRNFQLLLYCFQFDWLVDLGFSRNFLQ